MVDRAGSGSVGLECGSVVCLWVELISLADAGGPPEVFPEGAALDTLPKTRVREMASRCGVHLLDVEPLH